MYFVDLSLVFGASSSPAIFDRVAKIVLHLSCLKAGIPTGEADNILDDAFCVGREDEVNRWFSAYLYVCERIGVQLAPAEDRDKITPPSQVITLLGLEYDLGRWCWRMPGSKSTKLLQNLHDMFTASVVPFRLAQKVSGKLNHYSGVLGGTMGKFERSFLIYASGIWVQAD